MTPQPIVALPQLVITPPDTTPQQQTITTPQTTHTQSLQAIVLPSTPKQVRPTTLKKKKNFAIGYRTRKRRRKPRNQAVNQKVDLTLVKPHPTPVVKELGELPKVSEQSSVTAVCTNDINTDIQSKQTASGSDNCLNNETHFKTGDYVISIDSKDGDCPPMWRIEGKNVLQLFEVLENRESGSILYRNTSSYLRWSPSTKHKYLNQPVKIINSDDDTVIVELHKKSESLVDDNVSSPCDYSVHPQRENFDVYLQTLVSQALDSEFIPEIIKENDEYFLSHLEAIEEITSQKKDFLHQREHWSSQLATAVTTYPCISISSCEQEDRLCQVCNANKIQCSTQIHGQSYDLQTLQSKESKELACDFSLCDSCVQSITLYGRLHHHKYTFFQLACKKVNDVRKGDDKDSHMILEECLQDTEWMSQMFQTMLELWNSCDKYR